VRFGKFNWGAAFLSLLPGGLLIFLVVAARGGIVLKVALLIAFTLLALRACGLRFAKAEADTPAGHMSIRTDFDDPTDSTDR
jgi:hypothetical protein